MNASDERGFLREQIGGDEIASRLTRAYLLHLDPPCASSTGTWSDS